MLTKIPIQPIKTVSLLLLLSCSFMTRADNMENLARSLAKIRGDVEELQNALDLEKEAHHNRMQALSSQLTDLSVEQRRQKVTIEKLQQSLAQYAEENALAENSGETLKPVLLEVISDYKVYVQEGFPFKTEERLGELNILENQVSNNVLEPKKAANRVWAFIEDEIRLSKENGIYQQTIELDGEKRLADIAKLGSVLIYFQTRDRRMGMAQKQHGQWRFITTKSTEDRERIQQLFDSLKKQIRQGYFELPNPLQS